MELLLNNSKRLRHDGRLYVDFEKRGDKTVLVNLFHHAPLKGSREIYMNPLDSSEPTVYMMESSGGLMAGDHTKYKVKCAENASACLIPQSATIVYPSKYSEQISQQEIDVTLEKNASLFWKTEATIPFKDARFKGRTTIKMEESSTLLWGEVIAPGRLKRDEQFEYHFFDSNFQVWVENECVIFDKLSFQPDNCNLNKLGLLEEHVYMGSLWFVSPKVTDFDVAKMNAELQKYSEINVGISLIDGKAINMRWLASDLILLKKEMDKMWVKIRECI